MALTCSLRWRDVSTTGAGAACTADAGNMYTKTGAGATEAEIEEVSLASLAYATAPVVEYLVCKFRC